jgi:hypothetical protein
MLTMTNKGNGRDVDMKGVNEIKIWKDKERMTDNRMHNK